MGPKEQVQITFIQSVKKEASQKNKFKSSKITKSLTSNTHTNVDCQAQVRVQVQVRCRSGEGQDGPVQTSWAIP